MAGKRALIFILVGMMALPTTALSQTRRRAPQRSTTRTTKATDEKTAAEIKAGRVSVATQIKALTQFLYLLGGINKGIETVDSAVRAKQASSTVVQQNEQSKARIRSSLRSVREGLDKLEADFRLSPTLMSYYSYISGTALLGETAENLAATNRFDEAGRTLLKVVNQLSDALVAMR